MRLLQTPYELWIGIRYTGLWCVSPRYKRYNNFNSFIVVSSIVGIAIGVTALIIVLSVTNGFQKEVQDRTLSVLPHIESYLPGIAPERGLTWWKELSKVASYHSEIMAVAPFISAQAMLVQEQVFCGTQIRGIEPGLENEVSDIAKQMIQGQIENLNSKELGIILGYDLARTLGALYGDRVFMVVPQPSLHSIGFTPHIYQFTVVGIFLSGHHTYDSNLAFVAIENASRVFYANGTSGIRLRTGNIYSTPQIADDLKQRLPSYVKTVDWTYNNQNWFKALDTEKRMMRLVLVLVIGIATFNLFSSLITTVKDKQSEVAILLTLGAMPRNISCVFLAQGSLIGLFGTITGLLLGTILAYNIGNIVLGIEILFKVHFLSEETYLTNTLPSDLRWGDIACVSIISLFLSLLSTLYPSWKASRLHPAKVLL